MKITSVEESKKLKGKLLVYIDESYSFTISRDDYISFNLYEEKELTEDDIEYIKDTVNVRAAKYAAIKYIALKLRSTGEVSQKLKNEGYDDEVIEKVLDELKSMGYLDDYDYAKKFTNDRIKLKPKSEKLIKMELQNKGIDDGIIDKVISEAEINDFEIAKKILFKRFGKYDLNDEKILKKAHVFLHSRGFSFNLADKVIKSIIEETTY